jgi:hypothetical protein
MLASNHEIYILSLIIINKKSNDVLMSLQEKKNVNLLRNHQGLFGEPGFTIYFLMLLKKLD